jgi:hypothetical protein
VNSAPATPTNSLAPREPAGRPRRPATLLIVATLLGWVGIVSAGFAALERYGSTPGPRSNAAPCWPADASFPRGTGQATLVMFVHPKCPCTRASLAELEQFMTIAPHGVVARIVLWRPEGGGRNWERTDLAERAAAIPGTRVMVDVGGLEAARFGAVTSGETYLFDTAGRLQFHGGLTAGRGLAGPNAGVAALRSFVASGRASPAAATYGCPLTALACRASTEVCTP